MLILIQAYKMYMSFVMWVYTYLQGVQYQPEIVPTPLSLLSNEDDDPNMPFDVRPCAKLLTALQ